MSKSAEKGKGSGQDTDEDREKCWKSRDKYFACLDDKGIVVPGDEGQSQCSVLRKDYEQFCMKAMMNLFNEKRVQKKTSMAMARSRSSEGRRHTR